MQVSVADPEDLTVKMGDRVEAGQLIADRSRERQRLEAQQQQLSLGSGYCRTGGICDRT
ncbi:MAG: hypothetical protein ACTS2F_30015 [Thainema sp.]